jgi:hypothetical protein
LICAKDFQEPRDRREEEDMWQVHAAFRFGGYRTPELDVTPALCITMIVMVLGPIIQTGL